MENYTIELNMGCYKLRFTEKKVAIPELLETIVKQKNGEQSSNSGPTGSTVGGPITRIGK